MHSKKKLLVQTHQKHFPSNLLSSLNIDNNTNGYFNSTMYYKVVKKLNLHVFCYKVVPIVFQVALGTFSPFAVEATPVHP